MSMEECIISERDGQVLYNRYFHQDQMNVCQALESYYSYGSTAALFPSGMCAIDSLLQVLMIQNKWDSVNIVYGSELYCDTPRTIKYLSTNYIQAKLFKVDVMKDEDILKVFEKDLNFRYPTILFIEACSNPNGNVFNFKLLPRLKQLATRLKVIVDNTWLTSVIFNPFRFEEVDFVVNSLTKYYGADRSGILGAVLAREKEMGNMILDYGKIKGLHVSPLYCAEAHRNILKVKERILRTSEMTMNVAQYLSDKGYQVNYPRLMSSPSSERYREFFGSLGPSVFTITLQMKRNQALAWMRSSEKFRCVTSFGAADSRFDQWPSSRGNKTTCRFSVGFEDTAESIKREFDHLLAKI